MIKTYIGKKGYTIYKKYYSERELEKIKKDLTFKPFHIKGYGPESIPFSVYGFTKDKMFLPKMYGLHNLGVPDEIRLTEPNIISLQFNGTLRENQKIPVEKCIESAKKDGGGILCLPCGYGKTSISLYLVSRLSVKTIVIVNKEFLMDQWRERIEQFLPDARIGIIQQKKVDIENKDIVIAMLQSVAMRDYGSSIFSSFGCAIYDEVHCIPSKIFSKALRKINTKYHFGLSATPNRVDGMTKITKLYIGDLIYKPSKQNIKNPKNAKVFVIENNIKEIKEQKYYKYIKNYTGKPNVVHMISNIIQCPDRLLMICNIIKYLLHDKRHILILSERIQYLHDIEKTIKKLFKEDVPFSIGYYIGGMKKEERKRSENVDLLLASYSMAKEAMDIPILDTLVMVTSKSNIEQSVGRIMRKTEYPMERPPLIIDIVDDFSCFSSQARKRCVFYEKNHYPEYSFNYDMNIFKEIDEIKDTFSQTDIDIDLDQFEHSST